jgi:hypothetical protein
MGQNLSRPIFVETDLLDQPLRVTELVFKSDFIHVALFHFFTVSPTHSLCSEVKCLKYTVGMERNLSQRFSQSVSNSKAAIKQNCRTSFALVFLLEFSGYIYELLFPLRTDLTLWFSLKYLQGKRKKKK